LRRASASIEGATVDPDDVMAAGLEFEGEEAELAPPGQRGRLSGWGFAVGYAGAIVALPFLQAERYGGAFLAAAALFGGFALPAFVLLCSPSMCWSALGAAAAGTSWPSSLLASASGPCSRAWD
jgi:hypothetical protein